MHALVPALRPRSTRGFRAPRPNRAVATRDAGHNVAAVSAGTRLRMTTCMALALSVSHRLLQWRRHALRRAHGRSRRGSSPPAALQRMRDGERALAEGRYAEAREGVRDAASAQPRHRRSPCAPRADLFPGGQVRRGRPAAARGHPAEAGPAEGRCAAGDVAVGARPLRRGAAGLDEGILAVRRPGPAADGRTPPAADLHRTRTRCGCRDVALRLSRLYPDDPEVLYHSGPAVRELRLSADDEAGDRGAGSVWLHQAAGRRTRARASTMPRSANTGRCSRWRRVDRHPLPHRPRRCSNAPSKDGIGERPDAEARKAFEEELALDPTNANAAYELAEMHRKAGRARTGAQAVRAGVAHYPAFDDARVGLGRTLIALGRPAEALPHLQAALSAIPRTTSPTISWRRRTGRSETPPNRRRRSPSSSGCARRAARAALSGAEAGRHAAGARRKPPK